MLSATPCKTPPSSARSGAPDPRAARPLVTCGTCHEGGPPQPESVAGRGELGLLGCGGSGSARDARGGRVPGWWSRPRRAGRCCSRAARRGARTLRGARHGPHVTTASARRLPRIRRGHVAGDGVGVRAGECLGAGPGGRARLTRGFHLQGGAAVRDHPGCCDTGGTGRSECGIRGDRGTRHRAGPAARRRAPGGTRRIGRSGKRSQCCMPPAQSCPDWYGRHTKCPRG